MKIIRKILLFILLIIPFAASGVYLFKTLDASNGLASSQINCIIKDSRGFVWFGTPAGLYRFDGYTFKSFQCNSQDGTSLPDSYIKSIQEALDGDLWVETSSGYAVYHQQTETFERDMRQVLTKMGIQGNATIIHIDKQKNVWMVIPDKGVICYNMQQQLTYEFNYNNDTNSIPQGTICSIGECRDGAVIVYNDGRLVCLDVMHQQRVVWQNSIIATSKLRKTNTLKVFADQMDNIWLYGQGTLMVYDKAIRKWDTTIGNQLGLTGVNVDQMINGMAADRNGNIWIATDRNGLVRTNVNDRIFEQIVPTSMNTQKPIHDNLRAQCVYVDDTDLLWIGTEKSGVAYWGKDIYKFDSRLIGDVTALTEDGQGNMWYGTADNGVIGYTGQLASSKITAMAYTSDGSIWVGSKQNGLTRIKDGKSIIYSAARDSARKTLINDQITALTSDKIGNLWIATNGGLQVYNPRMNTFSSYTEQNGKLSSNHVTSLFYGKNNNLFVGTNEGLTIINLSSTETTNLTGNKTNLKTFTNNYITQLYQDSRNLLWIGTREGVNILDLTNDSLNYITQKDGLCNNAINGITEDKNHNIWLTTSNGVSRIVVQRNHEDGSFGYGINNYNTSDGLQSNEFNIGSILTRKDGNIIFGGLFGINWVRQQSSNETESLPRVMLTQLFIGEEEIETGHEYDGTVPLPQALNESNRIELANSQNTFTIKFAAGNYNQSERLQFMYWMEGLNDEWKNGDALTHGVTFNDLSSGTYTLHVKAMNANGAVSNQERTLEIHIARPWWISWWMLVFYAVVIIISPYLWKYGIEKITSIWKEKKLVLQQLRQQREDIKLASDELRQPMARMTSLIGTLAEHEKTIEGQEQLNALHGQMLQVITKIAEMQMSLEDPESRALEQANNTLQIDATGQVRLATYVADNELTSDLKALTSDESTKKFVVVMIDNSKDFLAFVRARLKDVYDFRVYDDILKALHDLDDIHADLVICKQDMPNMTGSELCNHLKMQRFSEKTKFILMTDKVLKPENIQEEGITVSADDYLSKPFNIQEAAMRFNRLLGITAEVVSERLIEGGETRVLETKNASMTTSTINYEALQKDNEQQQPNDVSSTASTNETDTEATETSCKEQAEIETDTPQTETPELDIAEEITEDITTADPTEEENTAEDSLMTNSMTEAIDRQLLKNVEQYVLHNMSRGQLNLEEMAAAMNMRRVPFFHKIKRITGMTPTELIKKLRLQHACTLLEKTNINMSELAINVGMMTAENFIKQFKENYGMSPLEYRLKYRK